MSFSHHSIVLWQEKNDTADKKLQQLLNDVCWVNIHYLPHSLLVFEIRNRLGYGARWTADGTVRMTCLCLLCGLSADMSLPQEFRGFLEPQMADGHAAGWRH